MVIDGLPSENSRRAYRRALEEFFVWHAENRPELNKALPISLRGSYYYRSGSTKQELKGNALMEFLLRKSGKTWDDVVEPRAALADIDEKSVERFKSDAARAGRLPVDNGELPLGEFLDKLRLTENGQLKLAAVVLFGKDSAGFYLNQIVKIGRFGVKDDDLKFQEVVEGNRCVFCAEPPDSSTEFFCQTG